jgi:hypothetical protein
MMADERYQWLDERAAELLLAGEPIELPDDADADVRVQAHRLFMALDSVMTGPARGPYPYECELPGEKAALEAFREAAAAVAGAGAEVTAEVARGPRSRHGVPSGRGFRSGRGPRWARSLRFGLGAVLVGCALGGVAFAAGGVLSMPFDEDAEQPQPGVTVSATVTPGPLATRSPATGGGGGSQQPDASTSPESGGETPGAGRSEDSGSGSDSRSDKGKDATQGRGKSAVELCKAYLEGELVGAENEKNRRRLERAAGSAAAVAGYCVQLLAAQDAVPGLGSGSGADAGDDEDGKSGGSNGDGDQKSGGGQGNSGQDSDKYSDEGLDTGTPTPTYTASAGAASQD